MAKAFGNTLLLALVLLATPLWAGDRSHRDPFGDYETVEFFTAGLGPFFYSGDLADGYNTSGGGMVRVGFKTTEYFSVVSSLGGVFAGSKANNLASKLYYDASLTGQLRLASLQGKSALIPHLEAGLGVIGLDGTSLTLIGGGGIDWRLWGDGAVGFQVLIEYLPDGGSLAIPGLLTFTYYP